MTVSAPGEECLTRTQTLQRESLTQIRQKQSEQSAPGLGAAAENAAKAGGINPGQAVNAGNKSGGSGSYGSRYSRHLDITV